MVISGRGSPPEFCRQDRRPQGLVLEGGSCGSSLGSGADLCDGWGRAEPPERVALSEASPTSEGDMSLRRLGLGTSRGQPCSVDTAGHKDHGGHAPCRQRHHVAAGRAAAGGLPILLELPAGCRSRTPATFGKGRPADGLAGFPNVQKDALGINWRTERGSHVCASKR